MTKKLKVFTAIELIINYKLNQSTFTIFKIDFEFARVKPCFIY